MYKRQVLEAGSVRAGDSVEVLDRPDHGVTIATVYRALMLEPDLLPDILTAEALPEEIKTQARRRTSA